MAAALGIGQLRLNPFTVNASADQLLFDLPSRLRIAIDDRGTVAFLGTSASDGSTDAFGSAGNEDDFIFQLQMHGALLSVCKNGPRSARRFFPGRKPASL